jgi:hypothetical protein
MFLGSSGSSVRGAGIPKIDNVLYLMVNDGIGGGQNCGVLPVQTGVHRTNFYVKRGDETSIAICARQGVATCAGIP